MKPHDEIWDTKHPINVDDVAEELSSLGLTQEILNNHANSPRNKVYKFASAPYTARLCEAIDGLVKFAGMVYNSGSSTCDAAQEVNSPAQTELETEHQPDFVAPDPEKTSVTNTVASGEGANQSQKSLVKSAGIEDTSLAGAIGAATGSGLGAYGLVKSAEELF